MIQFILLFIILFSGVEIKVPRKHLISPESIQIQKELGNGEFGVVQQGVWIDKEQVTRQVAIKSLSKERMQNSTVEFMKEYEIMQTIRDDNIVSLFGTFFSKLMKLLFVNIKKLTLCNLTAICVHILKINRNLNSF